MRTAQELYETVVLHQRKQGQKSHVPLSWSEEPGKTKNIIDYACRYRSPDGMQCAIGCLIPNQDYKPEMEGASLDDLVKSDLLGLKLSAEFYKNRRLLNTLQDIHDRKPLTEWEKQWRMVADDFQLRYPKP